MRKKKDLYRDLAFMVNIKDQRVKIKKNKTLSVRGLSKSKNNIIIVYVFGGGEEKDNI